MSDAREHDLGGWEVLRTAADRAHRLLGERLEACYAVGSLVHGGFAPDVSDVDGVLILDRCDERTPAIVADVLHLTRQRLPADGLVERLSLFWGDWETFAAPPPEATRLPPIVRRDLLEHGVPLHGPRPPGSLVAPTHDDVVRESAAFAADRLERDGEVALLHDPSGLLATGRRRMTKTVLFPVRFLATACAGLAGSNDEAVGWYVDAGRPQAELADAALRWRTAPVEDQRDAERLLADQLPALYAEALDAYIGLDAVPPAGRARLRALRTRLSV